MPICGAFRGRHEETPAEAKYKPFGAGLGKVAKRYKNPVLSDGTGSICKQVKEPGLLMLPRLVSQRTAMPTAQGFFTLSPCQIHRGCKTASKPAVGIALA